jgi:hypothetical protein
MSDLSDLSELRKQFDDLGVIGATLQFFFDMTNPPTFHLEQVPNNVRLLFVRAGKIVRNYPDLVKRTSPRALKSDDPEALWLTLLVDKYVDKSVLQQPQCGLPLGVSLSQQLIDEVLLQAERNKGRSTIHKKEKSTEARDKWIYERVLAGVRLAKIKSDLKKRKSWEPIESEQGIRQAAIRYAKRNNRPRPPSRLNLEG